MSVSPKGKEWRSPPNERRKDVDIELNTNSLEELVPSAKSMNIKNL